VLTLDRGTTHGLLAHSQNDVGTLASLPGAIDRSLLTEWLQKLEQGSGNVSHKPQDLLLREVLKVFPAAGAEGAAGAAGPVLGSPVTDESRKALANAVRTHYRAHREAVKMQADMDMKWWAARPGVAAAAAARAE
jgi:coproporphyrinogen III oxidase